MVPAGHRVVVQHIDGIVTFTTAPGGVAVLIQTGGHDITEFFPPNTVGLDGANGFDQPVLFYIDASSSAGVGVTGSGAIFMGGNSLQSVTLTGYELDCTVAACAPIATQ